MKKAFDRNVKPGELRIFADLERPAVALIAEDRGVFGFRVIPVSEFTSVCCDGEQVFGKRVYQFWNSCAVPRSFASRSWIVEVLPVGEYAAVLNSPLNTSHLTLTSLSPYQRANLFSIPDPVRTGTAGSGASGFAFPDFHFPLRKSAGFAIAAVFVFALVFAIHLGTGRSSSERTGTVRTIRVTSAPQPLEPLEACADAEEPAEAVAVAASPRIELEVPMCAQVESEPEVRGRAVAPRMAEVRKMGAADAGKAKDRYDVARMRALPLRTTDDRAIAVMTYLVCGVKAGDKEFGAKLVESTEKLVEYVRCDTIANEYTRRLVAVALCHAYVATKNPDLRVTAEEALDGLGDRRPVVIVARGYDLIEDWFASQRPARGRTARGTVAAPAVNYPDWFRFLNSRK